jgi:hypothetical protein
MAQAYKMIQGNEKIRTKEIFKHVDGGRTRQDADELNIKLKPAKLEVRKKFSHKELHQNGTRYQEK